MYRDVWRARSAAIAFTLCALSVDEVDATRMARIAQNTSGADRGAAEAIQPVVTDAPPALPANLPEQIRKAQAELRRLDCLNGRIDGKLGEQTRQAVRKFWASAKQPPTEVNITDQLIAELAEHGDNFCRPPRRFFGFGGRPGGIPRLPPFIFRGAPSGPATVAQPPAPESDPTH